MHVALIHFIADIFSLKLNKLVINFCSSLFVVVVLVRNITLQIVFCLLKNTPDLGLSLSHSHVDHG